jgi:polysaccharide pyruvyl transferase WcaK-like protein
MRILLFGAFGNKNFGDDLCLAALVHQLRKIQPDCDLTVSPMRSESINQNLAGDITVLNRNILDNPAEINQYDMLALGPGGIFEWPHEPFIHADWCRDITIPIVLMAVGVWPHRAYQPLFEKAAFLGARDHASYQNCKLMGGGDQVSLMPDPALASDYLEHASAQDAVYDIGFCLRQWLPMAYEQDRLLAECRELASVESLFVAFEGGVCEGASALNDDALGYEVSPEGRHVPYDLSLDSYLREIGQCNRLLAMRYHGCILGLRCGVPTAGISYLPKVSALFELLNMQSFCTAPADFTAEWFRTRPWDEFAEQAASGLAAVQKTYAESMERLVALIS